MIFISWLLNGLMALLYIQYGKRVMKYVSINRLRDFMIDILIGVISASSDLFINNEIVARIEGVIIPIGYIFIICAINKKNIKDYTIYCFFTLSTWLITCNISRQFFGITTKSFAQSSNNGLRIVYFIILVYYLLIICGCALEKTIMRAKTFKMINVFMTIFLSYLIFSFYGTCHISDTIIDPPILIFSVINVCSLILFDSLQRFFYEKTLRFTAFLEVYEGSKNSFIIEQKSSQEIRKVKHDIQNNLIVLRGLLNQGEIEQAKSLIDSELQLLQNMNYHKYTSVSEIDYSIATKKQKAEEKGIVFKTNIGVLSYGTVKKIDIALLMNYALDNAIESCLECTQEKNISLSMVVESHHLFIKIVNSCEKVDVSFDQTSKLEDRMNHGFGIRAMQELAMKYKGYVSLEQKENTVVTIIRLYVGE